MRLTEDGIERDALSQFDLFANNTLGYELKHVAAELTHGAVNSDMFHSNSVEWLQGPALASLAKKNPLYRAGNVLISIRHQDTVAIVNYEEQRALWAWGQGDLSGPHDATMLNNGNILIFDNGLARGWSRIVEVNPAKREIVWEYQAPKRTEFFTAGRGSCERLSNGNTLISESERGHAFEITRDGRIVWDYWIPMLNEDQYRATIVGVRRYPAALIDKLNRAVAAVP